MKNSAWIVVVIALAISACTSQKQTTSFVNDDVYNTSPSVAASPAASTAAADKGAQVVTSPDASKVQKKSSSSSFEADYNDYSYASRIDRFNSKDTTKSYFDDTYSGSAAGGTSWNSDPNVNLYLGFGTGYGFGPSYSFGLGYPYSNWGWDYGWGYPYYGYYGWGYPYYYGGYYPWYSPWYGGCCYCGYNDYYPPYYASSGTYYGSRTTLNPSDGNRTGIATRNTQSSGNSAYARNEKQESTPTSRPSAVPGRTDPANQQRYRYTRPSAGSRAENQRTTTRQTGQYSTTTTREQPQPRYIKPENVSPVSRSGGSQNYTSPVYRQPRSSQEYLAPRTQNRDVTRSSSDGSGTRSEGSYGTGSRSNATPVNTTRSYSPSPRSSSSGYSQPARTTPSQPAPTRSSGSYSAPERSGNSGSYSAPSRSNSSSSPSRSGGGGGSSSGSSSGGRRR